MSKKRVEMYEELLPDGRCNYRLPYIDKITGKNKKLSIIMESRSASNYKLALRILQERLDKIMGESDHSDLTIRALADLYLEERQTVIKPSTFMRNKFAIDHVCDWIGNDRRLSSLTVPYIRKVLKDHAPKPVTYNEYLKRFKAMLTWAYNNDYIQDASLANKLQRLPDTKKKERIAEKYLEREELVTLLDYLDDDYYNLLVEFLALSGLRIGEVIALKDSDIDQEYIHINKTFETNVKMVSDTPKTSASTRDVYLRPELKDCVNRIRSFMRVYKFERGIRTDLFYPGPEGDLLHYDAFRKYLRENSIKCLGRKITPHALRHTTASLLIAAGVPLETVTRMLGHSDSAITKEIYLHLTQELKKRDNDILTRASVL